MTLPRILEGSFRDRRYISMGKPKINENYLVSPLHHKILWFYITMNKTHIMELFKASQHLLSKGQEVSLHLSTVRGTGE